MFSINKQDRQKLGRMLFYFVSHNRENLREAKSLGTLYVSKDKNSIGKKSFDKGKFLEYREIKFMRNKEFRKKTGKFANQWGKHFKGLLINQYGFIPTVGIKDIIKENCYEFEKANYIYSIDMSKAFNQVSYKRIYFYLRKGFFLNAQDSKILAESMCFQGFLYQGHPLSPLFFNLHLQNSIIRLKGICDNLVAYADDINLFFKNRINRRKRNLIKKILLENDLVCNLKKCKIKNLKSGIKLLGFTYIKRKNLFQAKNLAKLKSKAKFFYKLRDIIPNKSNNVKIFSQKYEGILNYIKDIKKSASNFSNYGQTNILF